MKISLLNFNKSEFESCLLIFSDLVFMLLVLYLNFFIFSLNIITNKIMDSLKQILRSEFNQF